jgi:hypothetical protein
LPGIFHLDCVRKFLKQFDNKPGLVTHKVEAGRFELDFKNLLKHILGFEEPFILGVGVNFHPLFWNVGEFSFAQSEDQNRVGEYKIGDKIIDVYNITNWAPRRSFFIVDAKSFGILNQVELGKKDEKRFIEGKREPKNENQTHILEFNYHSYFKFDFVEAARFIKVVVGD